VARARPTFMPLGILSFLSESDGFHNDKSASLECHSCCRAMANGQSEMLKVAA